MSMVAIDMPRSRWTKPRVARLGFLIGRGLRAEAVAGDLIVSSTVFTVRTVAGNMGLAFNDVPRGNLMIDVGGKLDGLVEQARQRCETPEALASRALRILADDPTLLANVLDDEL